MPRFATAYAYEVGPGRYQSVLFDDLADMLAYAAKHPEHKVVAWYVHDYETKEWTDATTASYVASERIATPMASGLVSFANPDRAEVMAYCAGHAGDGLGRLAGQATGRRAGRRHGRQHGDDRARRSGRRRADAAAAGRACGAAGPGDRAGRG